MGSMGLTFTPVLVRHLLGPIGLSGPITSTYWTRSYSKHSGYPPAPPPTPLPSHPLYMGSVILQQL